MVVFEGEGGGRADALRRSACEAAAEFVLETTKDFEESWRYGEPLDFDSHLGAEFMKLAEPITTGHVGWDIGFATGVSNEVDHWRVVRRFELEVKPLHFGVTCAVVVNDVDGGGRVGQHPSCTAQSDASKGVEAADHTKELELGDGIAAETEWDRKGEEEAVAPTAEAGGGGAFLGGVG
jgi:hypothetical protein